MEKNPAIMPIFGQKTSILSELQYIMGQKSQEDAFFFLIFHEKINALTPIFCQYYPERPKIDHQTTRGLKSTSRGPDLTRIYINGFVHPIEERRFHIKRENRP